MDQRWLQTNKSQILIRVGGGVTRRTVLVEFVVPGERKDTKGNESIGVRPLDLVLVALLVSSLICSACCLRPRIEALLELVLRAQVWTFVF